MNDRGHLKIEQLSNYFIFVQKLGGCHFETLRLILALPSAILRRTGAILALPSAILNRELSLTINIQSLFNHFFYH